MDADVRQEDMPINNSEEWIEAIYACLKGICAAVPRSGKPTEEDAKAVRILAEAANMLAFPHSIY